MKLFVDDIEAKLDKLMVQQSHQSQAISTLMRFIAMSFKDLTDKITELEGKSDAEAAAITALLSALADMKAKLQAALDAAAGAPTDAAIQAVITEIDGHIGTAQAALDAANPPAPAAPAANP